MSSAMNPSSATKVAEPEEGSRTVSISRAQVGSDLERLVAGLSRLAGVGGGSTSTPAAGTDRWEDDEYVYFEATLEKPLPAIDVSIQGNLVMIRVARDPE